MPVRILLLEKLDQSPNNKKYFKSSWMKKTLIGKCNTGIVSRTYLYLSIVMDERIDKLNHNQ